MRRQQLSQGHKIVMFIGYVAVLYACQLTMGIFQQKIYKVPYANNDPNMPSQIFSDKITPYAFAAGMTSLLCYFLMPDSQFDSSVPIGQFARISACDILIHVCLVTALQRTTYTTMLIVNSTSLLSVVAVGAFCSRVKHEAQNSQKIGAEKLWICLMICLGVIVFTIFGQSSHSNQQTQHVQEHWGGVWVTALLFFVATVTQGFRPDFAAQMRQQYQPSALFWAFGVNAVVFVLGLAASIASWQISYFVVFAASHERLLIDLSIYSALVALSAVFVFKIISVFRQHIYPLVADIRKCLTLCVNNFWYGHHLAALQWMGVFLVFAGVMIEVINNYNLAQRLLPNSNVRNREGQQYNKLGINEDISAKGAIQAENQNISLEPVKTYQNQNTFSPNKLNGYKNTTQEVKNQKNDRQYQGSWGLQGQVEGI